MEITEVTSEGALILFTRYDLEVLRNTLSLVSQDADAERFEKQAGSALLEVQRMFEKVQSTYKRVTES